jgi:serine/threonine-protein kinase HipA
MLNGETLPVGKLWFYNRKGRMSASFEYNKKWLSNPNRFGLEPALPALQGMFHTDEKQSLFRSLGDSAPDRWGRVLMQRANAGGHALSELDYLLGVNDKTRQGALRFSETEGGEYLAAGDDSAIPPLVKLPELLSATEKFLADNASAAELKLLLAPGSSLGGARPKSSVLDKNGDLSIAKFPRKDDDVDIVRWEAVALTLARKAGINVPEFRLETIAGKSVLIIKRFDRDGDNRIPFLSAMSMLGATDKDDTHSYLDIVSALGMYGSQPDKDKAELWRRIVFGIMIRNTDDHLRNHGFLYEIGRGWKLSPAYDLNPNIEKSDFATSIDGTGANNTIEIALANARHFNLTDAQAKEILEQVRAAVADWWKVAKHLGIPENKIERMKPEFEVWNKD